jgi:hypothetical protein
VAKTAETELPLRITVVRPPPGMLFCVQGRAGEFLQSARSTGADISFDVTARDAGGDPPRLLGRIVQGPPTQRFVYVCSGTYAGETNTPWARRAKVPLIGVTRALIAKAKPGQHLAASITGTARDGGPVCASIPLLGAGWQWER